jgi:hypothetical protein
MRAYRFGKVVLSGDSIEQGAFPSSCATQNRDPDFFCVWNFAKFLGLALVRSESCAARIMLF